jgi:hypothetical protein
MSHAFFGGSGNALFAGALYREIDVTDGGTIRGTVKLVSHVSKVDELTVTKDEPICGRKKASPRLVVGRNNGVGNAIVYLEGITQGKKFGGNVKVTLDQRKCEYQPHILLLPLNGQLEIVNDDKILHNVHAYDLDAEMKTVFNIAQPIKGQRTAIKQTPKKKAGLVLTTCDAGHPWMSAHIMCIDHPYYAVTDANGNFSLENVPPGMYTLKMWHEGVAVTKTETENGKVKKYYFEDPYETVQEVTVPGHGSVTTSLEFSLR